MPTLLTLPACISMDMCTYCSMRVGLLSENRAELARFRVHDLGDHGGKELRFVLLLRTSMLGRRDAKAAMTMTSWANSWHTGITVLPHEICSIYNTMVYCTLHYVLSIQMWEKLSSLDTCIIEVKSDQITKEDRKNILGSRGLIALDHQSIFTHQYSRSVTRNILRMFFLFWTAPCWCFQIWREALFVGAVQSLQPLCLSEIFAGACLAP